MNLAERMFRADEQSLVPLVDLSPHLDFVDGRVRGVDLVDVPLDNNGIPQRVAFLRQVLGTVAADHYWTGYIDVHHLAWPGADYRNIHSEQDYFLGSQYRGAASLKIRLPRQLHNYIHKISLEPPMPPLDVMRQWSHEQVQIDRLYDTVKLTSLDDVEADHATKEGWRYSSYMSKLEEMSDGQLGLMPNREQLSRLEIDDARRALRCLARTRGMSNARRSRQWFNAEQLAA